MSALGRYMLGIVVGVDLRHSAFVVWNVLSTFLSLTAMQNADTVLYSS